MIDPAMQAILNRLTELERAFERLARVDGMLSDAMLAVQRKVGVDGSGDAGSIDYRLSKLEAE